MPESVKKELMPPRNAKELKQFILIHFPILSWLWSYQPKFLINDIIAGITVSVMHIPQGECIHQIIVKALYKAVYKYDEMVCS